MVGDHIALGHKATGLGPAAQLLLQPLGMRRMELGGFIFLLFFFTPLEVQSAPCDNGGTLVGPICMCPPGYNGTYCEHRDPSGGCRNGGTAVGTHCYCPPGFGGPLCEHPNATGACRNGATAFGTSCVCPPGYWGDVCQHRHRVSSCLNGGTLVEGGCRCPPSAWGPRCECIGPTATTTAVTVVPKVGSEKVSVTMVSVGHVTRPMEGNGLTSVDRSRVVMDSTTMVIESNTTASPIGAA
ncbi:uncharacterized protein PRD47_000984 [Ara ararauna]